MSDKKLTSCEEIQMQLLSGEFSGFSAPEKELFMQHLHDCADCHKYEEMIGAFRQAGIQTDPGDLKLFHLVKKNIMKSFRQSKKDTKLGEPALKDRFKAFITYKIPVYQVVGLFFVFGFAFILIMQGPLSPKNPQSNSQVAFQGDTVNIGYLDLSVNLNYMDHQNIGRNLEEDSVVARYIFKSL